MNFAYILIEINQFRTSSIDFVKLTAGHGVLYPFFCIRYYIIMKSHDCI